MSGNKTSLSRSAVNSGGSDSRIRNCGDSVPTNDPQALPSRYSPDADAYRELLHGLATVIAPLQALHQQAVEAQTPTVREILRSKSRDARLIEHTLDHLLDHACIPQGLSLFKSLCRHYWQLNPQATASYINAYRELWDSDDKNETGVAS